MKRIDRFPSRYPISISKDAWFYENERSIDVLIEHRDTNGKYIGTARANIRLSKLKLVLERATLSRKRRARRG